MAVTAKKIKSIVVWLILALVFFLLVAGVVIWIKIPGYVINELAGFTHEKSNGQYSLTIKKLKRGFFPVSLRFSDVNFSPTEIALSSYNINPDQTLYTFEASEIELAGIDLISLYKNRRFNINNIRFVKPVIKLEGEELLRPDSLEITSGLIKEIRPLFQFVNQVNIKKIEFEEANFGFYAAAGDSGFISKAEKVAVDVLGFRTDSEMIKNDAGFFATDDVLIRMNDFRNDMGDSLHVLTIDTLLYSLKTTDIRASGFRLFPFAQPADKNLFEVTVPDVYVKSRSITRFALNDSLKVGFLEFSKPEIRFFQKENPQRLNLEDIDNFDLYALVQNQFKILEVDSFFLWNAQLEIFRQPEKNDYRQRFESIDIILIGFALDSTSARNREKLLHADELEMKVAGYHLRLEDDEHHFSADSLFVSTFSDQIGLKKIHIYPEKESKTKNRTEVNIKCEALNIEEIILRNLYYTRTMPTNKIEIIEPNVNLLYHIEMDKNKKQEEAGLLFELVTDYLKGVYSNLVYIENGRLEIRNSYQNVLQGYFETTFNFSLTDFSLDSASVERTDRFFYATNFDLHFSDYQMRLVDDLHKLEAERVSVSSTNRQVQIENLNLQPAIENADISDLRKFNRSELFHISVPQINLRDVDLRNTFFNKKLRISSFNIIDPTIHFENFGVLRDEKESMELTEFYQLIFNYIEDFDIGSFSVPNGKLTWVNHTRRGRTTSFDNEFSASLENFRLNESEMAKERLLFSDNFDITIKDQEFELSDSVHVFKGNEIRLSSATSSVHVRNALLYPLITSKNYSRLATTYQVSIPELNIEGFDFKKAWYSQEPEIDRLELVSPKFQIYTQPELAKSLDLNAYRFPLPPFIESLQLNEFSINNGEAITYKTTGMQHRPQANFNFSFSMPGILLKNDQENQINLTSENIVFTVSNFRAPVDDYHNIGIDEIGFNREKKAISILNLKVNPFLAQKDRNRFSILVPEMTFSEFDLSEAHGNNNFNFKNIDIFNPEIAIEINQEIKEDTLEFLQTLDLYPFVETLVNQIKVENLNLNDVDLHLNWLRKPLFRNKINIEFKNILLSENQPPANLLNSQEFIISTTGLSAKSKDGLYEFSTDSLIYNSARHNLLVKNIEVNPLMPREFFPKQDGFQTDVAKAKIAFAELKGINEKRFLQENILNASLLNIGPAHVEIFRNKRFPFNHSQRPSWPQDLIKNTDQPFIFDSVKLAPSFIRYSELLGISDEPGFVEFNDLTFFGGTISNMENEWNKYGNFEMEASAKLMNQGLLEVNFSFDLASKNYQHTAKGKLESMPLSALNSMVTKSAPLFIEEGQLNRLEFDLAFDEKQSSGNLFFGYDNLKIAVLDYSSDEIQKARFATFLVNRMVLNSSNPKGNELHPVSIQYSRDEQRSILNFWWKSLYSGAREVLGMDK